MHLCQGISTSTDRFSSPTSLRCIKQLSKDLDGSGNVNAIAAVGKKLRETMSKGCAKGGVFMVFKVEPSFMREDEREVAFPTEIQHLLLSSRKCKESNEAVSPAVLAVG